MRTLCQSNLPYQSASAFYKNLSVVSEVAIMNDMSQLEKAMLEFKPDLMLLDCEHITPSVKAFCSKNKTKLIGFGNDNNGVDILITKEISVLHNGDNILLDVKFPTLELLTYRDRSIDKKDISVFVNDSSYTFIVDFLCKNYNIKVYGGLKINSPQYLGIPSEIDKYEIYNKSKYVIDFSSQSQADTVLLDAYPIIQSDVILDDRVLSFNTLIDLVSIMDTISEEGSYDSLSTKLESLKQDMINNSDVDFTDNFLSRLGFNTQDLKEEKGELLSC